MSAGLLSDMVARLDKCDLSYIIICITNTYMPSHPFLRTLRLAAYVVQLRNFPDHEEILERKIHTVLFMGNLPGIRFAFAFAATSSRITRTEIKHYAKQFTVDWNPAALRLLVGKLAAPGFRVFLLSDDIPRARRVVVVYSVPDGLLFFVRVRPAVPVAGVWWLYFINDIGECMHSRFSRFFSPVKSSWWFWKHV